MKTRQESGSLPCRKNNCRNCPGCRVDVEGSSNQKVTVKNDRAVKQRFSTTPTNSHVTRSLGSVKCARSLTDSVRTVNGVTGESLQSTESTQNQTEAQRDITEPDSDIEFEPVNAIITDEKIMKIDTKNYCMFCYKECNKRLGQKSSDKEEDVGSKEICSRYMKLLTRYLKLDIYKHIIPTETAEQDNFRQNFLEKSLEKGKIDLDIQACDACLINVKTFCDLYHQWQHIHLQLDWSIAKFRNVMKCAEKVPSRVGEFREKVLEGKNGMRKEEKVVLDGFKREFFRKSIPKRIPSVMMQRVKSSSDNGKFKCTRNVLLQKQLSKGQFLETRQKNSRVNAIDVLNIGQELRLTSRRQPDKKANVQMCTIRKSDKAEKKVPSLSEDVSSKPIKKISKAASSVSGTTRPTGKIPTKVTALPSTAQKLSRQDPSKGRRPGPHSRVSQDLNACHPKRKLIYGKRPKFSKSDNGPCVVIDLCDSDDDEREKDKKEDEQEDTKAPTSPKRAKICQATERQDTTDEVTCNGDVESQTEINHHDTSQNFETQNPQILPETNNTMPSSTSEQSEFNNLSDAEPEVTERTSTELTTNVIQDFESSEDTTNNSCFPDFPDSVQSEDVPDDNVHTESFAYAQPIIACNNEYLQDGPFLETHIELPTPPEQPGQGIEVTLEPGDEEVHSVSVTITQTFTSTFSGNPPDGAINIPIPSMFPAFNNSTSGFPPPEQYQHQYCENQFYSQPDNGFVQPFAENIPTEIHYDSISDPIVVEVEENADDQSSGRGENGVHISEMVEGVVEEPYDHSNSDDDVQIIDTLDHETGNFTVVMKSAEVRGEDTAGGTGTSDHSIVQNDTGDYVHA